MKNLKKFEIWFATGSQHLYGEETLKTGSRTFENYCKGI